MILYKSLNNQDMIDILNNKKLECSLLKSYKNVESYPIEVQDRIKLFYNKCCEDIDKSFILSLMYGHVNGRLAENNRSPWISVTSNFYTAYSYSNMEKHARNNILCIYVDDSLIIRNFRQLQERKIKKGTVIDLSNNKLVYYRMNGIISQFKMNGLDRDCFEKNLDINNYLTTDYQYLISNCIELNNYILLTPKMQNEIILSGIAPEEYISNELSDHGNSLQLVKKMV